MTAITGFRASPQQNALWQLQQAQAVHPYYSFLQLKVSGPASLDSIAERLQNLAAREEILRTRLQSLPGMQFPVQEIGDLGLVEFQSENLAHLSPALRTQHLLEHSIVSLGQGHVLRVILFQLDDNEYVLSLKALATHADRQSLRAIAMHLLNATEWPETVQYADYAEWRLSLIEADPSCAGISYWKQVQSEQAPPIHLGLESRTSRDFFSPGYKKCELAVEAGAGLAGLTRQSGKSVADILFFAWIVLLARLSGQATIEAGYISEGRNPELVNALGPFEQALPVRMNIAFSDSLPAQWDSLLGSLAQSMGWANYYDGGTRPNYLFSFHDDGELTIPYGGVQVLEEQSCLLPFKLSLSCTVSGNTLSFLFGYDRNSFGEEALLVLMEQWHKLLAGLAHNIQQPLAAINLLGERQHKLISAHDRAPEIEAVTILELIEQQALRNPDAIAVRDSAGALSYQELDQKANRLAHRLIADGVNPGDTVGILLPRCSDMIVSILAIHKAGAAYLPLDPAYPAERLGYMASDSSVKHVIGHSKLNALLKVSIELDLTPEELARLPLTTPAHRASLELPAYLIYTSGSTGQPKAVEVSQRNLSYSTQMRMAFYSRPVRSYLLLSSFAFDSSVAGIFWTLAQGGCLVLPDNGEELDMGKLCSLINEHQITHSLSLPSLYAALLNHASDSSLKSLDTWIVAGETCKESLLALHRERLPHARLVNEYGPTEASVWATAEVLDNNAADIGIGKPIPTVSLYLINDSGSLAAIGEQGEIYIGGPQLTSGYRGKPEQTAQAFLHHPATKPGERVYKTGDLARWRLDGGLSFLGRCDHQVKIRGHRVELQEIERRLMTHRDIQEALVIAQEHHGNNRLVAYVIGKHGYPPARGALRDFLADQLPAYMLPAVFVPMDSFPKTPNGKVDLRALPDPDIQTQQEKHYVAPRNPVEKLLASVCAEVLRLPQVGVSDNFFQIGGDSILSLQVVTRAERRGLRITAKQIFELQTIEKIAAAAVLHTRLSFNADGLQTQVISERSVLDKLAAIIEHYRVDLDDVLSALFCNGVFEMPALVMLRLRNGGNVAGSASSQQYGTLHTLKREDSDWALRLQSAKTALRANADPTAEAPAFSLKLSEAEGSIENQHSIRELQAPLHVAARLASDELTLSWTFDRRYYGVTQLNALTQRFERALSEFASHCPLNNNINLSASDFPTAGLDQEALADLLSELNMASDEKQ